MADHNSSPVYPFAGSFFSAKSVTPPNALPLMPVSNGDSSYSSIVLHLNGQMETFCVHGDAVLIRPCSDHEKARFLTYYQELSALVVRMKRAVNEAFYST